MEVKIESSWKNILKDEFEKPYFEQIKNKLVEFKNNWELIFPAWKAIFSAFELTPFDDVKVVILGQDPYHTPGQANWLAFSVAEWNPLPPSLVNIYKEIQDELGGQIPKSWDLSHWARQWVLLLNAILTVSAHKAASHQKIGWENFSDAVIKNISEQKSWIIFVLWWKYAQSKKSLIDTTKHFILESAHPSPLSASRWFFGSWIFKKINEILISQWNEPIKWFK